MQTVTPDRTKNVRIDLGLWLVGLLAIIASVAANLVVRLLAMATPGISFGPASTWLDWSIIWLTVLGVLGAVIVFALLVRFTRRPILMFKRIAAVALVLSFVPDILLLVAGRPVGVVGADGDARSGVGHKRWHAHHACWQKQREG